jgi:hypothetical protein
MQDFARGLAHAKKFPVAMELNLVAKLEVKLANRLTLAANKMAMEKQSTLPEQLAKQVLSTQVRLQAAANGSQTYATLFTKINSVIAAISFVPLPLAHLMAPAPAAAVAAVAAAAAAAKCACGMLAAIAGRLAQMKETIAKRMAGYSTAELKAKALCAPAVHLAAKARIKLLRLKFSLPKAAASGTRKQSATLYIPIKK